jgi:hypothetical protein
MKLTADDLFSRIGPLERLIKRDGERRQTGTPA